MDCEKFAKCLVHDLEVMITGKGGHMLMDYSTYLMNVTRITKYTLVIKFQQTTYFL